MTTLKVIGYEEALKYRDRKDFVIYYEGSDLEKLLLVSRHDDELNALIDVKLDKLLGGDWFVLDREGEWDDLIKFNENRQKWRSIGSVVV